MTQVHIKKVRAPASPQDGQRWLVDRLWPRGVSKEHAALDDHPRDVAPSTELRTWFGHDPAKFDEFTRRYREELDHSEAAAQLLRRIRDEKIGRVTLLFGAADEKHNQAVVLREWLREHLDS